MSIPLCTREKAQPQDTRVESNFLHRQRNLNPYATPEKLNEIDSQRVNEMGSSVSVQIYREGFYDDIRSNDLKSDVLEQLLDKYHSYQVITSRQMADWVDTSMNNLNASDVWNEFARYGLLGEVAKIYHAGQSNRMLIMPVVNWLDNWGGEPRIAPTPKEISNVPGSRQQLVGNRAEEAVGTVEYIQEQLQEQNSPTDPKEAFVYGKLYALDSTSLTDASVSVNIRKLDPTQTNQQHPDVYDAIEIEICVDGDISLSDPDEPEETFETIARNFALVSCYEHTPEPEEAKPVTDGKDEIPDDVPAPSQNGNDGYGPYVVNRREFVKEFEPDELNIKQDTWHYRAQLGPVWTKPEGRA